VLWEKYNMEKFKESTGTRKREIDVTSFTKPVFKKKIKVSLPKISDLNIGHPARRYLTERSISDSQLSRFYYAERFKEWTNSLKPTYGNTDNDEGRIIIPLLDESGDLFGYQGRTLNPKDKLRYVTVMLSDDVPKVYGLNEIDKSKTVYVVEGPFDSTFVRNAVAMCGSDVHLDRWSIDNPVYVYDNEPRNKQITDRISASIDRGNSVVIWPRSIAEKDINDMVLAGHNVQQVIESNTFSGLEAQVKLSEWKRV